MKKLATIAASLTLTACGSTGVLKVGNAKAEPRADGCDIAVFESEEDVGRPFEKLCLIDAKTGSTLYNNRSVSGAMKKVNAAACQCGADAVIVRAVEKKGVSLTSWGSSKASVLAIRYTTALPSDWTPLPVGTRLNDPTGAPYGEVVTAEREHRFADGRVDEAVRVKRTTGEEVWLSMDQARKLAAGPSPAPKE